MTNLQYRLCPEVGHLCKVMFFYFLGLSWLTLEGPVIHSESISNLVKRDKFHASYSEAGGTSFDNNTPPPCWGGMWTGWGLDVLDQRMCAWESG